MFCWLSKLQISNAADTDDRLSERTQRHIRRCPSCREFHQACLSLGEGLEREAAMPNDEFAERLSSRVRAAVPSSSTQTYKLPVDWMRAAAAASIGIALIVGAMFYALSPAEPPVSEPGPMIAGISDFMGRETPAAWANRAEKPLADELENIASDTESAVRFLVTCVAVDPARAWRKSQD